MTAALLPGRHVCSVLDSSDDRAAQVSRWQEQGREAGERVVTADAASYGRDWRLYAMKHGGA